jgi:hypothetical protein
MMNALLLNVDIYRLIVNFCWFSLFVILLLIGYRMLLRRFKRNVISNEDFVSLYPVQKGSGEIQFLFEAIKPGSATLKLFPKEGGEEIVLFDGDYTAGNTIIPFDTTKLSNGPYFYELKTEFQKSSKLLEIRN